MERLDGKLYICVEVMKYELTTTGKVQNDRNGVYWKWVLFYVLFYVWQDLMKQK